MLQQGDEEPIPPDDFLVKEENIPISVVAEKEKQQAVDSDDSNVPMKIPKWKQSLHECPYCKYRFPADSGLHKHLFRNACQKGKMFQIYREE